MDSKENVYNLVIRAVEGAYKYNKNQTTTHRKIRGEIKSFIKPFIQFFQPYYDAKFINYWSTGAWKHHVYINMPWDIKALMELDDILKQNGFKLVDAPERDPGSLTQTYKWENKSMKDQGKQLYELQVNLNAREDQSSELQQCRVEVIGEEVETVVKKQYKIVCNETLDWEEGL